MNLTAQLSAPRFHVSPALPSLFRGVGLLGLAGALALGFAVTTSRPPRAQPGVAAAPAAAVQPCTTAAAPDAAPPAKRS